MRVKNLLKNFVRKFKPGREEKYETLETMITHLLKTIPKLEDQSLICLNG